MARYRLTPKRRQNILRAQRKSAQRRGRRGVLMKMAINKTADALTKGGASKATDFFAKNEKRSKRSRKAKRRGSRRRRRRG